MTGLPRRGLHCFWPAWTSHGGATSLDKDATLLEVWPWLEWVGSASTIKPLLHKHGVVEGEDWYTPVGEAGAPHKAAMCFCNGASTAVPSPLPWLGGWHGQRSPGLSIKSLLIAAGTPKPGEETKKVPLHGWHMKKWSNINNNSPAFKLACTRDRVTYLPALDCLLDWKAKLKI